MLKDKTSVNPCRIVRTDAAYTTLGVGPDVGALFQDFCQDDGNKLLDSLATKITTENRRGEFSRSHPADANHTIKVTVDGAAGDETYFSYAPATTAIVCAKDSKPADGAPVVITFWSK